MKLSIEQQVKECEERLRQAMLESDVTTLDELLASDLIFTSHLGKLMTKQDDLEAHKLGMLKINEIELSEQSIKVYAGIAIVTVQAHIIGSFAGVISESDFRFSRVWKKTTSDTWQVIVGHSSIVT